MTKGGIYWLGVHGKTGILDTRLKKVLKIFSGYSLDKILDVGCGDGCLAKLLGEVSKAKEVYGIEISSEGVELAIKNGVKAYQKDLQKDEFPFEDDYFDAVFCGEIIEHIFDPDRFLQDVYRVLKSGGLCVLTTGNLASWHNRLALLLGFEPYGRQVSTRYNVGKFPIRGRFEGPEQAEHIKVFTLRGLKELLRIYNFKINRILGYPLTDQFPIPFPLNIVERILSLSPSLSLGVIYVLGK
jgi:methionine biosynthesis protein MetW